MAINLHEGKFFIIIGGGGRIGMSTALSISNSGGVPILVDKNQENLLNASKKLIDKKHFTFLNNFKNSKDIEETISCISEKYGSISGAVYTAYPHSEGWGKSIENLQEKYLYQDLNLQLGIPILFSKIMMHYFKKRKEGVLIHISSIHGLSAPKFKHYEGTNMYSPIEYSAIKAGIIAITKWLAKYYSGLNIRVNCVSPGGILSNQPKSFLEKYRDDCCNFGMLSGSDVGDVINFLLSDNSKGINGQNIIIDDGWSL